jgi:hypothetical protein
MPDRIVVLHLNGTPGGKHCSGCELLDKESLHDCPYFGALYSVPTGEFAGMAERPVECLAAELETAESREAVISETVANFQRGVKRMLDSLSPEERRVLELRFKTRR